MIAAGWSVVDSVSSTTAHPEDGGVSALCTLERRVEHLELEYYLDADDLVHWLNEAVPANPDDPDDGDLTTNESLALGFYAMTNAERTDVYRELGLVDSATVSSPSSQMPRT